MLRSQAIAFGARSKDESFAAFAHWLTLMAPPGRCRGDRSAASDYRVRRDPPDPRSARGKCPVGRCRVAAKTAGLPQPEAGIAGSHPCRQQRVSRQGVEYSPERHGMRPGVRPTENDAAEPRSRQPHSLVPLRREGSDPLFLIHGLGAMWPPAALGTWPGRGLPRVWASGQGLDAGQAPTIRSKPWPRFTCARYGRCNPGAIPIRGLVDGRIVALEAARQLGGAGEEVAAGGHARHLSFAGRLPEAGSG